MTDISDPRGSDAIAAGYHMSAGTADAKLRRQKREIERLRAALQKIADHPRGGCLASDADYMIDIAREALEIKHAAT